MWRPALIAIDLDDTLLDSKGGFSARSAAAVRAAAEQACRVVLATGSMHHRAAAFARELGISGPIISYNGALLRESDDSRTYHHLPLRPEEGLAVLRFADAHAVHANVYLDDALYIRERNQWSELYRARHRPNMVEYPNIAEVAARGPTKILLVAGPETIARLFPGLYVTRSKQEYLEFVNPQASKGKALRVLTEKVLGLSAAQVMALGDAYNDIDMIQYAALGVAPANAPAEVRALAHHVCPSNDEDGPAMAIEAVLAGHLQPAET